MISAPKSGLSSDALIQAGVKLIELGNQMQDLADMLFNMPGDVPSCAAYEIERIVSRIRDVERFCEKLSTAVAVMEGKADD